MTVIINYMKTIDITPKWEYLIHVMVEVLRNPKASNESVREIKTELISLAKFVDRVNEDRKNERSN